jgi:hypothetical protein
MFGDTAVPRVRSLHLRPNASEGMVLIEMAALCFKWGRAALTVLRQPSILSRFLTILDGFD